MWWGTVVVVSRSWPYVSIVASWRTARPWWAVRAWWWWYWTAANWGSRTAHAVDRGTRSSSVSFSKHVSKSCPSWHIVTSPSKQKNHQNHLPRSIIVPPRRTPRAPIHPPGTATIPRQRAPPDGAPPRRWRAPPGQRTPGPAATIIPSPPTICLAGLWVPVSVAETTASTSSAAATEPVGAAGALVAARRRYVAVGGRAPGPVAVAAHQGTPGRPAWGAVAVEWPIGFSRSIACHFTIFVSGGGILSIVSLTEWEL